ncbi:glycoside hydrolase family 3 protein [Phototrophicus methaneseepsis]|uniref:beta-glucosidase n=1 Tax=Phototrophicus methaneseepsis TaxID=2710758 RepID=A0A7S8IGF5_9CHLR|nr:glycoside hydrolase family 3 protein [Phototrophicus methaneseepsis]QPC84706.1 glycoside hydrolase family 3 protein [Phototrophicus methaneseepsis]
MEQSTAYKDATRTIEERIDSLLAQMTLDEKIGQMTQPEKNSITPEDVTKYFIGSVLSGGGGNPTPNNGESWAQMVKGFQKAALETRLGIPLLYGVDAVHGHNNVVGATIFPHNIGMGATRDADLVERCAQVTAQELLATGVHWDFAPAVSIPHDFRWGRSYEGYADNPAVVSELGAAFVRGLQAPNGGEAHILPSVKHYVADGGTTWGSKKSYEWIEFVWESETDKWSIDQGDAQIDEETLRTIFLPPYKAAIEQGALNVMASYSMWNGVKLHGHKYLLTDVLKDELGFEGFIVTDWMAIDQLSENYYDAVVHSINAGIDMNMVPFDYKRFITVMKEAVEKGDISMARVDDAVRRILRAKFWQGLFEKPITDDHWLDDFGGEAHREVAREAVRKSLVLLKNENHALPLTAEAGPVLVAGEGADDIGLACGGWTIEWMGNKGAITPGSTLLEGLKAQLGDENVKYSAEGAFSTTEKAPVAVVVVGEDPYAEGEGDTSNLALRAEHVALVERVRAVCDKLVLVIYSGRPVILSDVLAECDAIVAAWLPGTEANAIADVLVGEAPFEGKLGHNWPRSMDQVPLSALKASDQGPLYPYGHGLSL